MERANLFERVPGGDGVDEQEPLARAHVLLPHGAAREEAGDQQDKGRDWRMGKPRQTAVLCSPVLFLTSGVKNIKKGHFIINDTLLSI